MVRKGQHLSEEAKRKISEATKKGMSNPEVKKKMSETHKGKPTWNKGKKGVMPTPWMKGKHHTQEALFKMRASHKGHIAWNKGKTGIYSEETKRKIGLANKGKHTWNLGKTFSGEVKRKISEAHKKAYAEGRIISWNKGKTGIYSEETKRKIGLASKERRVNLILPIKDTKIEIKIQNFLKQLSIEFFTHQYMPIEHGYQSDILIPSLNLIIECDGDAFHFNPQKYNKDYRMFKNGMTAEQRWKLDADRTKELIDKGFKVLRLWESDINKMNLNDFMNRIKPFQKV